MKSVTPSLFAAVAALSSAVLAAPAPIIMKPMSLVSSFDVTGLVGSKHADKFQSVSFTLTTGTTSVVNCNASPYHEGSEASCIGNQIQFDTPTKFKIENNSLTVSMGDAVSTIPLSGLDCHVNGGDMQGGDSVNKNCRQTQPLSIQLHGEDGKAIGVPVQTSD